MLQRRFSIAPMVDERVKTGERIVICGPSGSGKSTLIRCINRLEWRDINIYNELGIPALTYGPRAANHVFKRALSIESLYQAAGVYARIAIDLCSKMK